MKETRESMGVVLKGPEVPVMKDVEKMRVLSATLTLLLPVRLSFTNPRPLRPERRSGARKPYPWRGRMGLGTV